MLLHGEHEGTGPAHQRLVLIHGFTQTARCWGPVARALARDRQVLRLDAPGHGGSSKVRANLHDTARLIAESAGPAIYLGYSMGARMALHVALEHPQVVRGLVLVGGTAGIEDRAERVARRQRDRAQAQRIRQVGVEAFVQDWLDQPLFAGLPPEARFETERRRNAAEALASSLELAGTGSQEARWQDLDGLTMPVLAVAGAEDIRYAAIATRMAEAIGTNAEVALIPQAGHAAHLERPDAFLAVLTSWLERAPARPPPTTP